MPRLRYKDKFMEIMYNELYNFLSFFVVCYFFQNQLFFKTTVLIKIRTAFVWPGLHPPTQRIQLIACWIIVHVLTFFIFFKKNLSVSYRLDPIRAEVLSVRSPRSVSPDLGSNCVAKVISR